MKVLLGILGFFAIIGVICFTSYVSAYNYGNTMDNLMNATIDENQNIYAITGKKVQEVAQVPGMFKDDQKEIIKAAIEGRYGKDGSKQVFLMVSEMNPGLDASLYKKIQEVIESSNNEFQAGQKQLIERTRSYKTAIGSLWTGFWMRVAGFPKIDLNDKKYKPITTQDAIDTFESGIAKPVKLR